MCLVTSEKFVAAIARKRDGYMPASERGHKKCRNCRAVPERLVKMAGDALKVILHVFGHCQHAIPHAEMPSDRGRMLAFVV